MKRLIVLCSVLDNQDRRIPDSSLAACNTAFVNAVNQDTLAQRTCIELATPYPYLEAWISAAHPDGGSRDRFPACAQTPGSAAGAYVTDAEQAKAPTAVKLDTDVPFANLWSLYAD